MIRSPRLISRAANTPRPWMAERRTTIVGSGSRRALRVRGWRESLAERSLIARMDRGCFVCPIGRRLSCDKSKVRAQARAEREPLVERPARGGADIMAAGE